MSTNMTPAPGGGTAETVKLGDCPIGLFMFGDTLCFKAEYAGDIFIVETGEAFWGGTSVNGDRAELMVRPMSIAAALAAAHAAGFAEGEREQMEWDARAECNFCGNPYWSAAEYDAQRGHFYHLNHEIGRKYGPDICGADRLRRAALRPGHAAGGGCAVTPELLDLGNRLHRAETDYGHHRFDCTVCFLGDACDEAGSILDEMAKVRAAFWREWDKVAPAPAAGHAADTGGGETKP